jgi:AcrR family transcriptional regulator
MSAIENGKVGLTVDRLQQIARRVGMAAGELLELKAPPAAPAVPDARAAPWTGWREFGPLELDPVLGSAVEVFNETGYHGATMRVIATGADISIAGMYHHYPSKQHLLVALLDLALTDLHRRVDAAGAEAGDPVQQFTNTVEALALFHTERAELAYIVLTEMRSVEEPNRSRLSGVQRQVRQALDGAAARVVDAARCGPRDLPTTTRAITTMCLTLPYWFPGAGSAEPPAQLARRYAELALDMMRCAAE